MEERKYICPICNRGFISQKEIGKHSLPCWQKAHPNHVSKPALQKENINTRQINNDVLNFFNSFKGE